MKTANHSKFSKLKVLTPYLGATVGEPTALSFELNFVDLQNWLSRPTFNFIENHEKMGGTPDKLNLFGIQGHTGMDNYLIKDFLIK